MINDRPELQQLGGGGEAVISIPMISVVLRIKFRVLLMGCIWVSMHLIALNPSNC